jgi:O-antigen ligase
MILLSRIRSAALKIVLTLSLASSISVIILIAKKGPLLGLVVILLFLVIFVNRRYFKFLLGFVFLAGCLICFSEPILSSYKRVINSKTSLTIRAENYFYGLHVFKENPIWGVGSEANLVKRLDDYNLKFSDNLSRIRYQNHIKNQKTFENIVLAFLVELGGIFTITYFGGVLYTIFVCFKKIRASSQKDISGMFIVSVMVGFAAISLTFDTLRFPSLNWLFHSLLGLMVTLPFKTPRD